MKHPIHTKLLSLVQTERTIKVEILNFLEQAEKIKFYIPTYRNLTEYCHKELGYTDSEAQRRIDAMRILRRKPFLKPKVEAGLITASQLSELNKVDNFLKKEGKGDLLDTIIPLIEKKSVRDTLDILKKELDLPIRKKIVLNVEDETYQKWVILRNRNGNFNLSDDKIMNLMIEATTQLQSVPVVVRKLKQDSRIASPNLKRKLLIEAKHQCEWPGCTNKMNLHADHIIPWCKGGKTEYMNLQILCQTHNNLRRHV